jgi:ketol-acid reductoisomerase
VIGYGNQGRAQALNLLDGGMDVTVGLREGSSRGAEARGLGLRVLPVAQAAAQADVIMMLAPDEALSDIYAAVAPVIRPGAALGFAHGLAIHFRLIAPRADLDVFMVAPKGPGTALRANYVAGGGMAGLFAIAQDAGGGARALALAYGRAIGCGRVGLIETDFAQETEADLFNEGAVLWGAVPELMLAGYDTLVEAGVSPEVAWLECVGELRLLADLIAQRGIAGMREAISTTAEFAGLSGAGRVVTDNTRAAMRALLAEVRSGAMARAMTEDASNGSPRLLAARKAQAAHPSEGIGARLRPLLG